MKRFLALTLALTMLFSLAACGSKNDTDEPDDNKKSSADKENDDEDDGDEKEKEGENNGAELSGTIVEFNGATIRIPAGYKKTEEKEDGTLVYEKALNSITLSLANVSGEDGFVKHVSLMRAFMQLDTDDVKCVLLTDREYQIDGYNAAYFLSKASSPTGESEECLELMLTVEKDGLAVTIQTILYEAEVDAAVQQMYETVSFA